MHRNPKPIATQGPIHISKLVRNGLAVCIKAVPKESKERVNG